MKLAFYINHNFFLCLEGGKVEGLYAAYFHMSGLIFTGQIEFANESGNTVMHIRIKGVMTHATPDQMKDFGDNLEDERINIEKTLTMARNSGFLHHIF